MSRRLNVLIADDSEDDALLLVRVLRRSGFSVHFTRIDTSVDMRHQLSNHVWDLVVSDHFMPGFGSEEALQLAHSHDPNLPVIVVSGVIDESFAINAISAGAEDFIMKEKLGSIVEVIERIFAEC